MKKKSIIILGITVAILAISYIVTATGERETLVIDNPNYKEKSSKSLELLQVICNDTATILNMEVTGPPKNWIRLQMVYTFILMMAINTSY